LQYPTHVKLVPEIIHVVVVSFNAVATPYCANDLDPVVPAPARYNVSVVMAIVTTEALILTNVNAAPMGNASVPLAGIVNVLALASLDGW
jgi:hypothetical protein